MRPGNDSLTNGGSGIVRVLQNAFGHRECHLGVVGDCVRFNIQSTAADHLGKLPSCRWGDKDNKIALYLNMWYTTRIPVYYSIQQLYQG